MTAAQAAYAAAFAAADRAGAAVLARLAADPLLREAVTWQNRGFVARLDTLRDADPAGRDYKRRQHERTLVRYWQRYCGKNETVGFFGPALWVRFDPGQAERVRVSPGPGLVRFREVLLERWCVDAYAQRLAEDPRFRRWLRPVVAPHVWVEGRRALLPGRPPVALSPAEAAALGALAEMVPLVLC